MARIKRLLFWVWKILTTPAATLSLAFLTLGGFVGGVIFWGAFNTALELTNPRSFASPVMRCGPMYMRSYAHGSFLQPLGRPGVLSRLPRPHEWTDKIARKMQASKEVWGKIFGTINTREKFLDHRLELAKHEWARLKANDSLECRNCHSSAAMDLSKQTQRAAEIHTRYLLPGRATCIDCHKGIAHELPNMQGVEPGWKLPPELEGETLPSASAIDELKRVMDEAHSAALAN